MGICKVCKCGHSASYHKIKQNYDKKGKYVSCFYTECLVDVCNCKKFDHVDTVNFRERLGKFGDGIN